jgi:hypothetical protein
MCLDRSLRNLRDCRSPRPVRSARHVALVAIAVALAACDLGVTDPVAPPAAGTITVDASAAFAYVAFDGDTLKPVAETDPRTSTAWALGLFGTTITSNGGAAGPGGVEVACLCANASATNAEVMAMTAESEVAEFDSVSAGAATTATFGADQLATAINGWYTNTGAMATLVAGRSWIVREGSPTALLGKLRIISVANPTATAMGTVRIEFAVQPSAGAAFNTTDTLEVTVGTDPVFVDLTTGAVSTSANWDIQLAGWTIRVNSGVSGSGTFRAVLDTSTPYEDITHTYASFVPAQAYATDSFTGVFATNPWYRYNLTGTDHQVWPTFNVYLVRRAGALFKVQVIGYYGLDGTPRQITLRYQRLAD